MQLKMKTRKFSQKTCLGLKSGNFFNIKVKIPQCLNQYQKQCLIQYQYQDQYILILTDFINQWRIFFNRCSEFQSFGVRRWIFFLQWLGYDYNQLILSVGQGKSMIFDIKSNQICYTTCQPLFNQPGFNPIGQVPVDCRPFEDLKIH